MSDVKTRVRRLSRKDYLALHGLAALAQQSARRVREYERAMCDVLLLDIENYDESWPVHDHIWDCDGVDINALLKELDIDVVGGTE